MLEKQFLESIDCKFPYNESRKWKELVKTALSISDDSVFWVIYELVKPPKSWKWKINKIDSLDVLFYANQNFKHPLKARIFEISETIITDNPIKLSEIQDAMDQIKLYRWLYSALNILYLAREDLDGSIEKKYDEVLVYWEL